MSADFVDLKNLVNSIRKIEQQLGKFNKEVQIPEKRLIKNKIVKILCERFLTIWKPLQEKYAQQLNYCIHREHYFQMR